MSFSRPDKNQQGVTLVELMVAMVLSMFLVGGVTQIYLSNSQSYRVTEASSRVQENSRFAFRFLTRDIRMAGYQGCAGQTMTVTNTLNPSGSSFLYDFGVAVQGFEATGSSTWTPTVDASITSPLGGSDILVIRGMFDEGIEITGQPNNAADCNNSSSYTADLKVSSAGSLLGGDIVIAGDCSRASIFQITNINPGGNIVHNTGGATTPGNSTKDLATCYAGNGQLYKVVTRVFYIRNNTAGIPSLYSKDGAANAQELVEGVEDMQIEYGLGSGVNNLLASFETANTVNTNNDWDRVISVRINLLMRSIQDSITTKPQAYDFNGSAVTASDRRLHRVFTTTIALRNKLK